MTEPPFFSIVVPSYLEPFTSAGGRYHSATNRVEKFQRAVQSVVDQTFADWELLIVADGCEKTRAMRGDYVGDLRIKFFRGPKQRQWNGKVRNAGIYYATGRYIIYLDTDDTYGEAHLQNVHLGLTGANEPGWAVTDDMVWDKAGERWMLRPINGVLKLKGAGTQNIVHRRDLGIYWPDEPPRHPHYGYGRDDRGMVKALQMVGDPVYITGAEHYLMHIPNEYDL